MDVSEVPEYTSQPVITCSKVTNRSTKTRCEIGHWRRSGVFIVNVEHISHLALVFPLLSLSR